MANFEVFGKCDIKKPITTVESAVQIIKRSLCRHYDVNKIKFTPSGLMLKGNLKAFFSHAVTHATVHVEIVGGKLTYRAEGTASLGIWPWAILCFGFLTNFVLGCFVFFLGWFLGDVVSFFVCRSKPEQYFEDAFKAVQFELG